MKKLFLASYSNLVIDKVIDILPNKPKYLNLAFIPTARNPYKITATFDPEKEKLKSMGFNIKEIDIKSRSIKQLQKDFKGIDVIFIAGGNTFYLLEKVLENGFDKLLKKMVNNGVVYIGSSAGSVLIGPDIDIVKGLDDPNEAPHLSTTKGIGLVDFIVLPHYGEGELKEKIDRIYEKWKHSPYKVIPLTNRQAVIVEGETYRVVESGLPN